MARPLAKQPFVLCAASMLSLVFMATSTHFGSLGLTSKVLANMRPNYTFQRTPVHRSRFLQTLRRRRR